MKFGHIELFVHDPVSSRNFYVNKLGFEVESDEDPNAIWIMLGTTEILLRKGKRITTPSYQEANVGLVIYSDNLSSAKKKMESEGVIFKGIDGSEKCLTFTDPDGHWLQLVNPNDH